MILSRSDKGWKIKDDIFFQKTWFLFFRERNSSERVLHHWFLPEVVREREKKDLVER